MTATEFNNFATEFTGLRIKIYKPQDLTKWAIYSPLSNNAVLEPSTKYGICIKNELLYDFKTTKKVDTFLKSFVNQHINKYEMKQGTYEIINGFAEFVTPKKEDILKKYTNQNRVSKYFFYTTLYGIGMFAIFTRDIKSATSVLAEYLKSKNIQYSNEYSDAGWAYRFVINKDVDTHNKLLEGFEM